VAVLNPLLTLLLVFVVTASDIFSIVIKQPRKNQTKTKNQPKPSKALLQCSQISFIHFFNLDAYQIQPCLAAVLCSASHNQRTEALYA